MGEPTDPPTSWGRRWLPRVVIGAAVSGAIVGALLTQVDLARIAETLGRAHPGMVALGLGLYVVLGAIRAWRVRVLMPDARFTALLAITSVHQLLLRVLPMRTGELGFAWLMRRSGEAGFAKSLVGLLLLRVLDLTTVLAIYAAALLVLDDGARSEGGRSIVLVLCVAGSGVVLALSVRSLLRIGHWLADRLVGALGLSRFARIERGRRSVADAVAWSNDLPKRVLFQATGLTMLQWVVSFAWIYVMAVALRLDVTGTEAVLGGVGTVVGSLLPVPGIGTFGGLEAGWAAGFALAGVDAQDAITSAFGFSAITFGYSAAIALAGWLWIALRGRPQN